MKPGDLVKFKNNGMLGLIVKLTKCDLGDRGNGYTISWMDGHTGNRWADELEVISATR